MTSTPNLFSSSIIIILLLSLHLTESYFVTNLSSSTHSKQLAKTFNSQVHLTIPSRSPLNKPLPFHPLTIKKNSAFLYISPCSAGQTARQRNWVRQTETARSLTSSQTASYAQYNIMSCFPIRQRKMHFRFLIRPSPKEITSLAHAPTYIHTDMVRLLDQDSCLPAGDISLGCISTCQRGGREEMCRSSRHPSKHPQDEPERWSTQPNNHSTNSGTLKYDCRFDSDWGWLCVSIKRREG